MPPVSPRWFYPRARRVGCRLHPLTLPSWTPTSSLSWPASVLSEIGGTVEKGQRHRERQVIQVAVVLGMVAFEEGGQVGHQPVRRTLSQEVDETAPGGSQILDRAVDGPSREGASRDPGFDDRRVHEPTCRPGDQRVCETLLKAWQTDLTVQKRAHEPGQDGGTGSGDGTLDEPHQPRPAPGGPPTQNPAGECSSAGYRQRVEPLVPLQFVPWTRACPRDILTPRRGRVSTLGERADPRARQIVASFLQLIPYPEPDTVVCHELSEVEGASVPKGGCTGHG